MQSCSRRDWAPPKGYANGIAARGKAGVRRRPDRLECAGRSSRPPISSGRRGRRSRNIVAVLAEAGARPEHIVRMTWYVVDKREYLASCKALGAAYREIMGRHFPAMTAVEVTRADRGRGAGRDRGDRRDPGVRLTQDGTPCEYFPATPRSAVQSPRHHRRNHAGAGGWLARRLPMPVGSTSRSPTMNAPLPVRTPAQGEVRLGRPAAARRAAYGGGAHGARHRARLRAGQADAARHRGVPAREDRTRRSFREMGALGLLGRDAAAGYGGAGLNYVCYGLIAREVERVDSGYRSMMSVQSSLVMFPIFTYGSEAQRQNTCRSSRPANGSAASGSPSPNHGSDPGSMMTRARTAPGGYTLSGAKMWISQFADRRRVRRLGEGPTTASSAASSSRRA